jgi:hypothetical protein
MAQILSIIKLCIDLGVVVLEMLHAAVKLYKQYVVEIMSNEEAYAS